METQLWAIWMVLVACFLASLGPIMLKKATKNLSLKIMDLIKNKYLWGGVFFYGLGTLLFIPALKGGELSVLYPLVSTTYIWVTLWSVRILKEKMNKYKIIGLVVVLLGVVLIGIGA